MSNASPSAADRRAGESAGVTARRATWVRPRPVLSAVLACWALGGCGASRPEPVAAHVAIEVVGEGVARTGVVAVDPGSEVRLHAVLEAHSEDGEAFYYTDAPALELAGRPVASESLSTWAGPRCAQVLWLTLEPERRYVELAGPERLERFAYDAFARPEWGRGWIAEAEFELSSQQDLEVNAGRTVDFGTRFVQAWVELSEQRDAILPQERFKSPGPEVLLENPASVTTLVLRSQGPLGAAQRAFGLAQLELAPELSEEGSSEAASAVRERLRALHEQGLAFSRIELLRDLTDDAGRPFAELAWSPVELGAGAGWGNDVAPGDLLRVGVRWVVLLEDAAEGAPGVLDGADRGLDFEQGASVVRLSEVFVGDGVVELARLAGTTQASAAVR